MSKKIIGEIRLQLPAGSANPAPPVGPALGQRGINIMEFCKAFNASTQKLEQGMPIPVIITVFQDKSFTFETKSPPVSFFIKKALKLKYLTTIIKMYQSPSIQCIGINTVVPNKEIHIKDELDQYSWNEGQLKKIQKNIGIKTRRIVSSNVTTIDLMVLAAKNLIDGMNFNKDDIDGLIVVTQTPDYRVSL